MIGFFVGANNKNVPRRNNLIFIKCYWNLCRVAFELYALREE